jgi:tRNA U34 2-thiouridine synthase MnmA/TrmU
VPLDVSPFTLLCRCRFQEFLPQYLEPQKGGSFVSVVDGTVMGTHSGAALYTVGQGAKVAHIDT